MPTIAEKARAEAEAAEAEDQEQEPTEEPGAQAEAEPTEEPAPDPAEGLDEPTEAMMVELGVACNDHHDHVRQIMGGFVEGFAPCDDCNGIGLAIPRPAKRQLKPRQGAVECSVCGGEGELELPTKREQFQVEQCTNCNGKGWVGSGNLPVEAAAAAAVASFPGAGGEQPVQQHDSQPPSTDPRVQQLRSEGFIVLEKPGS